MQKEIFDDSAPDPIGELTAAQGTDPLIMVFFKKRPTQKSKTAK